MDTSNTIAFLTSVISFMQQTYSDWSAVIPEGLEFEQECHNVLNIIQPILENDEDLDIYLKQYTMNKCKDKIIYKGMKGIIKNIITLIYNAQKKLYEFMDRNNSKLSFRLFVRTWVASDYRQYYIAETKRIRNLLDDLCRTQQIDVVESTRRLKHFENKMPKEAYIFWKKSMGDILRVKWIDFADSYQLLYREWSDEEKGTLKRKLCDVGDELTIFGFISLIKNHGFPMTGEIIIKYEIISEDSRIKVIEIVMKFIEDFSSDKMAKHLTHIYDWYNREIMDKYSSHQERANHWGVLRMTSRYKKYCEKTPEEIEADNVNEARRYISFFYQRYMVLWRVGKISRETFADVDFPGKARIKDFLRYVEPLDHANYHVVIHSNTPDIEKKEFISNWPTKKPKVYRFLEEMIRNEPKYRV
jgi:hypothetical protein